MINLFKMMWQYDENSSQFKNEFLKRNLETETEQIKPHKSPTDLAVKHGRKFYSVVDKKIYQNLKDQLKESGLIDHLNNIASIIKQYYTRKILFELNENSIEQFNTEFQALYKFLGKEWSSIKFNGLQTKDKGITVKHPGLMHLIIHSFLRQLKNNYTAYNLIASNNLNHYRTWSMGTDLESEAAYELFVYIQSETSYKYKSSEQDIEVGKLTNQFCHLIHELLLIGGIVTENQTDTPAAFTRNRINRFMEAEPNRIALLKKEKELLNFASVFPDAAFFQEIVNVKNELNSKLRNSHLKQ